MKLSFDPKNLAADLGAGATMAIVAIPDAVASALLAGVNPTFGFNALMIGVPVGSFFTSSEFMNIGLTAAMMMAAAGGLAEFSGDALPTALLTLTILIGAFQLLLGLLKLGTFTRFISNAVMIGFLTGVATVLIFGQLGDLTGYQSAYSNKIAQGVDLLFNLPSVDWASTLVGIGTILVILLFNRTPLKNYSLAIAVVISSAAVLLLNLDSVALVGDTNEISGAIPLPALPDISMMGKLLVPAVSIGILGLIQGAGISQTYPNPDGNYPDPSQDFTGQGIANLVSGFFRGLPVGGSLGGTAVIIGAGAKSRWANVFMGLLVGVFVLLFAKQVENIAIPAVAAVLIVAGFGTFRLEAMKDIRDVSRSAMLVGLLTFLVTLILPIQQAILIGVLISILDYVYTSSRDVELLTLDLAEDGSFVVKPAPKKLTDNSVTALYALGNFFFAGARTLEEMLPEVGTARRPVVILRLRGRNTIGSTFVVVLERYARKLRANGGKLMLSGVSERIYQQLLDTETDEIIPERDMFAATDKLGESTRVAIAAARQWMEQSP